VDIEQKLGSIDKIGLKYSSNDTIGTNYRSYDVTGPKYGIVQECQSTFLLSQKYGSTYTVGYHCGDHSKSKVAPYSNRDSSQYHIKDGSDNPLLRNTMGQNFGHELCLDDVSKDHGRQSENKDGGDSKRFDRQFSVPAGMFRRPSVPIPKHCNQGDNPQPIQRRASVDCLQMSEPVSDVHLKRSASLWVKGSRQMDAQVYDEHRNKLEKSDQIQPRGASMSDIYGQKEDVRKRVSLDSGIHSVDSDSQFSGHTSRHGAVSYGVVLKMEGPGHLHIDYHGRGAERKNVHERDYPVYELDYPEMNDQFRRQDLQFPSEPDLRKVPSQQPKKEPGKRKGELFIMTVSSESGNEC
jgi:hypothetical protein